MNPETALQNQIRLVCSRGPTRLFRMQSGRYALGDGRMVASGFKGAPDLVGYTSRVFATAGSPTMIAVMVAIEVKTARGRITDAQRNFLMTIRAAGGLAGVARSVDDAERILRGEMTTI